MRKEESSTRTADEARILKFLSEQEGSYPEPKLIEALFGIKMSDDELPTSEQDLARVQEIRNILNRLVASKRIYASVLEDPNTREEILNYSSKGFFATP